ncbi:hypothetical protein BN1723_004208 [Verticillium longisporum]|uniref:Uncharacterized protein n=1 Tax=Verticillium longisporum TaxID=100787 RepID=A0A0G4MPY7_VERLO|nr:hypothetical protein BN1723_004208 [Verticillium longisporum]
MTADARHGLYTTGLYTSLGRKSALDAIFGTVFNSTSNLSTNSKSSHFATATETVKMDPYSAEGELINIHNHFHQGQYQEVIDYDTSSLSAENALPARVLVLRSRIALGQSAEVLAELRPLDPSTPRPLDPSITTQSAKRGL